MLRSAHSKVALRSRACPRRPSRSTASRSGPKNGGGYDLSWQCCRTRGCAAAARAPASEVATSEAEDKSREELRVLNGKLAEFNALTEDPDLGSAAAASMSPLQERLDKLQDEVDHGVPR